MAKPKTKCFYCGEEVEDDDKVIENVTEKSRRGFHKSKNCFQEYLNNDKKTKSMLQKEAEEESKAENKAEWAEWDTVYQYVKKEVLGYTEGMILSPYQRRRLQSLRNGTFIARGSTMQNMGYSYKIILDTFKICKQQIINATKGKTFEDEQHRFAYLMKIVESSINDVYNRHQHVEKQKQMIRQIDHSSVDLNTSKEEYRKNVTAKRQKNKVASLFKDLL